MVADYLNLMGKAFINFTEEKGLGNKEFKVSGKPGPGTLARVYAINEDNNGNLWMGTVDAGVWKYDGNNLMNFTTKDGLASNAINTIYKDRLGELWFGTDSDGICKFNGKTFTAFVIQ
jgi:ligand-binding sensor domain-containing protein